MFFPGVMYQCFSFRRSRNATDDDQFKKVKVYFLFSPAPLTLSLQQRFQASFTFEKIRVYFLIPLGRVVLDYTHEFAFLPVVHEFVFFRSRDHQ